MPSMVSELPRGYTYERDGSGGRLADTAVRQWRILLSAPFEAYDVQAAIGVKIGDPLSGTNPLPCVNLSVAADGDNRMTQIVTARYATTPGNAQNNGDDPGNDAPDERIAIVNVSTSITEVPSWTWYEVDPGGNVQGNRKAAVNPVEDLYDGVARIEPITIVTVEQFDYPTDPMTHCQHVGKVNSNTFTWRGLTVPKRCFLFRGLNFGPQNLYWGDNLYRGWKSRYEFAFRRNEQAIGAPGNPVRSECGWDIAVPQTGFNYKDAGVKKRATVKLADAGVDVDVPSAQPVPLNDDGSMRALANGVLVYRYGYHDEANFSTTFAHLRIQ